MLILYMITICYLVNYFAGDANILFFSFHAQKTVLPGKDYCASQLTMRQFNIVVYGRESELRFFEAMDGY